MSKALGHDGLVPFKCEAFKISNHVASSVNFACIFKLYSPSSNAINLLYSNGENVATINLFTPRAYLPDKGITLTVDYQSVSFLSG